MGIKVIDTRSCPATGGSLKVLTTECEDASRECTSCPTSVSALPRPQSTCYQLVSERFLYSVLSNCVSVSLMPTLGSGARKTNKYRDFSVCQIWCLPCFYLNFQKLTAFLEIFFLCTVYSENVGDP